MFILTICKTGVSQLGKSDQDGNKKWTEMREHQDGRPPTWEIAQLGENPHGSGGQMGKWAHIEKKVDPVWVTEIGKLNPDGINEPKWVGSSQVLRPIFE